MSVQVGLHVNRGCPQGSALGPLLWNIFQNDLSHFITTNLSTYADDHQIYHTGRDQSSVMLKLKESALQATEWYDSNLLAGNLKKYKVMNIGYGQNDDNTIQVIRLNNHDINTTSSLKLLGVIIDSNLNFSEHINTICKKASQKIGVLTRLRNLIPENAKLVLFKTAILPYLTYCHLVWHFCKASDSRKIERLQEGACVLSLGIILATLSF